MMAFNLSAFKFPLDLASDNNIKHQKAFLDYCSLTNKTDDIILAPEGLYSTSKPMTPEEIDEFVALFTPLSKGKVIIPGTVLRTDGENLYNTAYVFADGKLIHTYNKETETNESSVYKMPYETGNNSSSTFEWKGKRFGLEICRDHGMGRLKKYLGKSKEEEVDYQIILANNSSFSPRNLAIKEDGLAILVDGMSDNPSVSVTNKKNSKLLDPDEVVESVEKYLV